jgi:hypothetical protein
VIGNYSGVRNVRHAAKRETLFEIMGQKRETSRNFMLLHVGFEST